MNEVCSKNCKDCKDDCDDCEDCKDDCEDCKDDCEDFIDSRVRKDVAIFLRDLADKLETGSLSSSDTAQISEFFMKFNFLKKIAVSSGEQSIPKETESGESEESDEEESDDILKFMSLGWYVYTHLIPRLHDSEEEN